MSSLNEAQPHQLKCSLKSKEMNRKRSQSSTKQSETIKFSTVEQDT